jgi:hypothetical protein
VTVALIAVLVGLLGNVLLDPLNVEVFTVYFLAAAAVVAAMFLRLRLLRLVLAVSKALVDRVQGWNEGVREVILREVKRINERGVVYFTSADDFATLNRAVLYVLQNEQTNRLRVVHVYEREDEIPAELADHLHTLDRIYPQLRIDFLAVKGTFGPKLIEALSRRLRVPKNWMFIGTPGDRFPHRVEELGGVRLVL